MSSAPSISLDWSDTVKIDQLLYFVETARFEHIGKAAKSLAISPSAISHAIANLEEEVGRSLFEKKGKRIFLTTHGKAFVERAKAVIAEIENLKSTFEREDRELRGRFRIAASHMLGSHLLAPAWAEMAKNSQELFCEAYSLRSVQVVAGVAAGEFDFGICFSPQVHPDIESEVVMSGDLLIGVRKNHPWAKSASSEWLKKVDNYHSAMPKAFQGIDVCESHPVLEKHGVVAKATFVYDSYEVAASYLRKSNAWGFLPDWVISESGLTALPHPKTWRAPYNVSVVYPRNRLVQKVVTSMIAVLKARCS